MTQLGEELLPHRLLLLRWLGNKSDLQILLVALLDGRRGLQGLCLCLVIRSGLILFVELADSIGSVIHDVIVAVVELER